jgi:hypothetical protein
MKWGRIGKEVFVIYMYFKTDCCPLEELRKTVRNLSQDIGSLVKGSD